LEANNDLDIARNPMMTPGDASGRTH